MSSDPLYRIPISGIYVLDPSGIPLFARYYQDEMENTDLTLLGGFFSAIEIFVKTSLDGLLSDIGMTDSRFYFDRTDSGYIMIIIVESSENGLIDPGTLEIVRNLQNTINLCFGVISASASQNMMKTEIYIEQLGSTIDSFLLESSFEYLEIANLEIDYFENLNSQQLSDDKLDRIVELIKSNR